MIREDTYLCPDERVAVLHALDKAVCQRLASIGRWDLGRAAPARRGLCGVRTGGSPAVADRAEHGFGVPVVVGLAGVVVISALMLALVPGRLDLRAWP